MPGEPVRVMKEEAILEIANVLPYRTSCRLNWSGVEVHRYRLQPHEAPEHTYPQLTIFLPHTERPVRVEVRLAGTKVAAEVSEGVVTIAPPGVPRSTKTDGGGEVTAIFLDPVIVAEIATAQQDLYNFEILPQFAIRDPLIHAIGSALDSEVLSAAPEPPVYAESLATALAAHILAKYSNKTPARGRGVSLTTKQLRRSIEFIHENLHNDVSLVEIAAAANMSKYHFAKSFRQAVGIAPHKYLVKLRIERARKLLLSEDLSVEEIAHRVGYTDKSHFAAQFVKIVGTTPYRYRHTQ
ncbi:MAG TPA: AraC family transcriptional regulator [Bryobacteraceae bacterium]|nr:AraC family transcriptional regulator [Bryobacteraceae bacterium]